MDQAEDQRDDWPHMGCGEMRGEVQQNAGKCRRYVRGCRKDAQRRGWGGRQRCGAVLERCKSGAGAVRERHGIGAGAVRERCGGGAGAARERCGSGAGARALSRRSPAVPVSLASASCFS